MYRVMWMSNIGNADARCFDRYDECGPAIRGARGVVESAEQLQIEAIAMVLDEQGEVVRAFVTTAIATKGKGAS